MFGLLSFEFSGSLEHSIYCSRPLVTCHNLNDALYSVVFILAIQQFNSCKQVVKRKPGSVVVEFRPHVWNRATIRDRIKQHVRNVYWHSSVAIEYNSTGSVIRRVHQWSQCCQKFANHQCHGGLQSQPKLYTWLMIWVIIGSYCSLSCCTAWWLTPLTLVIVDKMLASSSNFQSLFMHPRKSRLAFGAPVQV